MSMTNLTDRHKELAKCGIPDNLTTLANSKMSFPTKLSELNPMFTSTLIQGTSTYINPQNNIDTNVAAFETSNGESVAAFYNPFCQADANVEEEHYVQPYMCANFIYDLNGKKGPNKVGKDIGFISALYPVETEVVAPMPLTKNAGTSSMKQMLAAAACREQDINSRLPNADELSSMFYNRQLVGILSGSYWSSVIDLKYNIKLSNTADHKAIRQAFGSGKRASFRRESKSNVRCIKR